MHSTWRPLTSDHLFPISAADSDYFRCGSHDMIWWCCYYLVVSSFRQRWGLIFVVPSSLSNSVPRMSNMTRKTMLFFIGDIWGCPERAEWWEETGILLINECCFECLMNQAVWSVCSTNPEGFSASVKTNCQRKLDKHMTPCLHLTLCLHGFASFSTCHSCASRWTIAENWNKKILLRLLQVQIMVLQRKPDAVVSGRQHSTGSWDWLASL